MNEPATATAAIVVAAELEKAVAETGLAPDGAQSLKVAFAPHFARFHEVAENARGVPATAPKKAREIRLELRAIRVAADKTRKALKEDSLRRGRAIDGINALLEYQLVPIEGALEAIEKAEEIAEAKRVADLKAARSAELATYADPTFYDLGNMPAAQWDQLLAGAKAAHEAKLAAAARAEAERVAAEKAAAEVRAKREAEEAAERERLRAENERLAKEAAEARRQREEAERAAAAERAEAERLAAAEREKARQEREAAEAKARAEREAIERKAAEERAEAEHAAKLEREKREEAEAKLRRQAAADAKRAAEEKAAAKRAAAAPDKQKLKALAESVRAISVPKLTSEAGAPLANKIAEQVAKFAAWLDAEAAKL